MKTDDRWLLIRFVPCEAHPGRLPDRTVAEYVKKDNMILIDRERFNRLDPRYQHAALRCRSVLVVS